jgi:hypothetical protein
MLGGDGFSNDPSERRWTEPRLHYATGVKLLLRSFLFSIVLNGFPCFSRQRILTPIIEKMSLTMTGFFSEINKFALRNMRCKLAGTLITSTYCPSFFLSFFILTIKIAETA